MNVVNIQHVCIINEIVFEMAQFALLHPDVKAFVYKDVDDFVTLGVMCDFVEERVMSGSPMDRFRFALRWTLGKEIHPFFGHRYNSWRRTPDRYYWVKAGTKREGAIKISEQCSACVIPKKFFSVSGTPAAGQREFRRWNTAMAWLAASLVLSKEYIPC